MSVGPASEPAAEGKRFYRPELDVLRFLCFLLIFIHHSCPRIRENAASAIVDACSFGMSVFFLLSSYLITDLLIRELHRTRAVHVGAFYLRRILRIWPLYFAFFGLCWLLGHEHFVAAPLQGKVTLYYLLMAGNWYMIRYGVPASPVAILWSISLEEQFYAVWPWMVRLGGVRAIRAISWLMLPLSYVSLWLYARHGYPGDSAWVSTPTQMQFFAVGGLLALALHGEGRAFSLPARAGMLATTAVTWYYAAWACRLKRFDAGLSPKHACVGYLLMAVGATTLFLAFHGFNVGRSRVSQGLVYLGRISYGLYVFHYLALLVANWLLPLLHGDPANLWLRNAAAMAITIGLAMLSYQVLERPFLLLKQRFTFVRSRPV